MGLKDDFVWGDDAKGHIERLERERDAAVADAAGARKLSANLGRDLHASEFEIRELREKLRDSGEKNVRLHSEKKRLEFLLSEQGRGQDQAELARLRKDVDRLKKELARAREPDVSAYTALLNAMDDGDGPMGEDFVALENLRQWLVDGKRCRRIPAMGELKKILLRLGFEQLEGPGRNGAFSAYVKGQKITARVYRRKTSRIPKDLWRGDEIDVEHLFTLAGLLP